jgi:hypothetical protein
MDFESRNLRRRRGTVRLACENLEGRQMMSGITASLNTSFKPPVLVINGSPNSNDTIHVTESGGNVSVVGVSIAQTRVVAGVPITIYATSVPAASLGSIQIIPGAGNDLIQLDASVKVNATVYAGSGNNTVIAGSGTDTIWAGNGTDTLISIGGGHNTIFGGTGLDTFWVDSTVKVLNVNVAEKVLGTVHTITAFAFLFQAKPGGGFNIDAPQLALNNPQLLDPTTTIPGASVKNFSSDPLFATGGPAPGDIQQGAAGDCVFLAPLKGIAKYEPFLIRQMIVGLGDGTYVVDFKPNGAKGPDDFIRVNADLPVNSAGNPLYAKLGPQNSLWPALLEKAWCFERPTATGWWNQNVGTYGMINGGGPNELYSKMSLPWVSLNSSNLWNEVVADVSAGMMVTLQTPASVSPGLVASHCYVVDHLNYSTVNILGVSIKYVSSITLRNPWGGSNEFVNVSYTTVKAGNFNSGCAATSI